LHDVLGMRDVHGLAWKNRSADCQKDRGERPVLMIQQELHTKPKDERKESVERNQTTGVRKRATDQQLCNENGPANGWTHAGRR
jgi:hypothetical protein